MSFNFNVTVIKLRIMKRSIFIKNYLFSDTNQGLFYKTCIYVSNLDSVLKIIFTKLQELPKT